MAPFPNHQADRRVPRDMERSPFKLRLSEESLSDAQYVAQIERGADGRHEHQAGVGPAASSRDALEALLITMRPQRLDHRMGMRRVRRLLAVFGSMKISFPATP